MIRCCSCGTIIDDIESGLEVFVDISGTPVGYDTGRTGKVCFDCYLFINGGEQWRRKSTYQG